MIKVLIVSDSHGNIDVLENVIEKENDCSYIFHLGDHHTDLFEVSNDLSNKCIAKVKGNCDYENEKIDRCFELGGMKIFMTHGHYYGVKMTLNSLFYKAQEEDANIALFGHTHNQLLEEFGDITLFNPGTIGMKIPGERTYGILKIDEETGEYSLKHKYI